MRFENGIRPAYVFIDVPNVVHYKDVPCLINWRALLERLRTHALIDVKLQTATAYLVQNHSSAGLRGDAYTNAVQAFKPELLKIRKVTVTPRYSSQEKDVDVFLVSDIWRYLVQAARLAPLM